MRHSFFAAAATALLFIAGCGSASLKSAGQTCEFSSQCGDGLFCDLSQKPAVCIAAGGLRDLTLVVHDMAVKGDQGANNDQGATDDQGVVGTGDMTASADDLSGADLKSTGTTDLKTNASDMSVQVDMAERD